MTNTCDQIYANARQFCQRTPKVPTFYDGKTNTCISEQIIPQFHDEVDNTWLNSFITGLIYPILASIVIISNAIVIIVLRFQRSKTSTIDPLLSMAVCALMSAIIPLPFTLYYYTFEHKLDTHQTLQLCYLHRFCMELLPFFFNTLTTLFTVLLGGQRFIAVHYPLQSVYWCRRSTVNRISIGFVLLTALWTLIISSEQFHMLLHICVDSDTPIDNPAWVPRCVVGHSRWVQLIGSNLWFDISQLARVLILMVAPCILLLVLTILLIRAIRQAGEVQLQTRRHRRASNRSSSRNTTIMLTVVIAMFLIAKIPSAIVIVLLTTMTWLPDVEWLRAIYPYLESYQPIANLIVIGIHPITFAFYMLMSKRFRCALRHLLRGRLLISSTNFTVMTSVATTTK